MSKEPADRWTQIIVAIITVAGTLSVALLTNRPQQTPVPHAPEAHVQPKAPAQPEEESPGTGGSGTPPESSRQPEQSARKATQPSKRAGPPRSTEPPASPAEPVESAEPLGRPAAQEASQPGEESRPPEEPTIDLNRIGQQEESQPRREGRPPEEPVIDLSGTWQDQYGNISVITQHGDTFEFVGRSPTYGLTSQGSGQVRGQQFETQYRTSIPSMGRSQGTVSPDGRQMSGTIQDSVLGGFYSTSIKR